MDLTIYDKSGNTAETIKAGESSELIQQFQGQNVIQVNYLANRMLNIDLGYYITFEGQNYYINKPPAIAKGGTNRFEYQIFFDAPKYDLARVQLKTIDNTQFVDGLTEFYLHGNAQLFVQLIVDNMNEVFGADTWQIGTIESTDRKLLKFKGENCLSALKKVAQKFALEFQVNARVIDLQETIENNKNLTLAYGKGNGIKSIQRAVKNNEKILTRLYAYGSSKNLPYDYRDHARRLRFGKIYNILGTAGLMDDHSKWTYDADGYFFLTSDDYKFSTAAIACKGIGGPHHGHRQIDLSAGTYFFLSAWVHMRYYDGPYTPNEQEVYVGDSDNKVAKITHTTPDGVWYRKGIKFQKNDNTTAVYFGKVDGGADNVFDGIQLTEITEEEYNNYTNDELLDRYPFSSSNQTLNYVEQNINKYGVREATKFFDDIFPHHTSTVTGVDNPTTFYDSNCPFDVNNQLISGVTAKVHFQTGNLAGYEFEISSYDNSNGKFVINTISGKQGKTIPNDTLKPQVDDQFKIIDIKMPQDPYINDAEAELKNRAQTYLAKRSAPFQIVGYELELDWQYCSNNSLKFKPGDSFTLDDSDFNINEIFRVIKVRRPLPFPYKQQIKIAKHPENNEYVEMKIEQNKLKENQEISQVGDINRAINEKTHIV